MANSADEARAQAAQSDAARAAAAAASAADINDLAKRFGQGGDLSIETDSYGNFRLVQNKSGQTVPAFFVVADNGKDWDIFTQGQIVKKYKTDAAKGAGLEALRKKLYEIGFISKKEYTTKDEAAFNNAISAAANAHSMEQVQKYTLNPGQKAYAFTPFSGWLNTKKSGLTPDTPNIDTDVQKTNKLNTDQDIDAFVLDMLGRKATPEEKAAYYAKVSEEQSKATRKATVKGTVQTTTGEFLNEDDYFRIAAAVIEPSIKGTPLADIGKLGGKVAKQVTDLKDYARDYGIRLDSKKALEYVMSGLAPGGSLKTGALDTQKNIIREMSKAFYSNLAPMIDAGVKVADIASQFATYKGKVLELPDEAIDVFDDDIQAALTNRDATGKQQNGVMSLTDFQVKLRKDPRWSKTNNAREEASSYANSILKSFGLVG